MYDVEEYKVVNSLMKSPGLFNSQSIRPKQGNTNVSLHERTPRDWMSAFEETVYGHYKTFLRGYPHYSLDDMPFDILRRLLNKLFDAPARNWLEQTRTGNWEQLVAAFKDKFCLKKREAQAKIE